MPYTSSGQYPPPYVVGYPGHTCAGKKEKVNIFTDLTNLSPTTATAIFCGSLNMKTYSSTPAKFPTTYFVKYSILILYFLRPKILDLYILIYLFFSYPTSNFPVNLPTSLVLNYMLSPLLFSHPIRLHFASLLTSHPIPSQFHLSSGLLQ